MTIAMRMPPHITHSYGSQPLPAVGTGWLACRPQSHLPTYVTISPGLTRSLLPVETGSPPAPDGGITAKKYRMPEKQCSTRAAAGCSKRLEARFY